MGKDVKTDMNHRDVSMQGMDHMYHMDRTSKGYYSKKVLKGQCKMDVTQ